MVAAVFYGHDRTERLKALFVLVYGACAEVSAAGKTYARFSEATQLCAEQIR